MPCILQDKQSTVYSRSYLACGDICSQEEDHLDQDDVSPLIPPIYQPAPPPPMTNISSQNTNVVELQPMGSQQQPHTIQVVQPPQANDHLWFTIALMVLCFLMCCNATGALCLMPALICASLVSRC